MFKISSNIKECFDKHCYKMSFSIFGLQFLILRRHVAIPARRPSLFIKWLIFC